jgi:hypothetical protein
MADVQLHANRTLRRRTLSSGEQRGVDGYFSLAHGERPAWWHDGMVDTPREVIGIFENVPASHVDAVVIGREGITVLRASQPAFLAYREVVQLDPPRKDPQPDFIQCMTRDGGSFAIPIRRREGHIMDIYRFLLSAIRDTGPGKPNTPT